MEPSRIQALWKAFDMAVDAAESADTKASLLALKALAEMMNGRLASIEQQLIAIANK